MEERRWAERAARFGHVAQGVSFGLVAWLAIKVALHEGGRTTDRAGALRTISHHPVGRIIVIALAVGFGAYALWRLFEVFMGETIERGKKRGIGKRLASLGKAAIYAALCYAAVRALTGSGGGNEQKKATAGILGWPAGRYIVYAIAGVIAAAALWNLYRGATGRFRKQLKTGEMSPRELKWTTRVGVVGLLSRAVVFGLIAAFFFKAAHEYSAGEANGLDGALRKLAQQTYGSVLLGVVAAGLAAFGVFCLIQARYREVCRGPLRREAGTPRASPPRRASPSARSDAS